MILQVRDSITYAGFWRRFAATALDLVVSLLALVTLILTFPRDWLALYVLFIVLYDIGSHYRLGATLGQRLVRIQVINRQGLHPSLWLCIVRFFCRGISSLPLNYGYLRMLWDDQHQTWHDEIAGTFVIRTDAASPAVTVMIAPKPFRWRFLLTALTAWIVVIFGGWYVSYLCYRESDCFAAHQSLLATDKIATAMLGSDLQVELERTSPFVWLPSDVSMGGWTVVKVKGNRDSLQARFIAHSDGSITLPIYYRVSGQEWVDDDAVQDSLSRSFAKSANCLFMSGDTVGAVASSRKALFLSHDYSWIKASRNEVLTDTASSRELVEGDYFKHYHPEYVGELTYLNLRALALCVFAQPESARVLLDSIIIRHPWFLVAYIDKGWTYSLEGKTDSAIANYDYFLDAVADSFAVDIESARRLRDEAIAGHLRQSQRLTESEAKPGYLHSKKNDQ